MTDGVVKEHRAPSRPDDAALLEQALNAAALQTSDLTPTVYERFFAKRPDALPLFQPDGAARGQMLAEAIFLLLDSAEGKDYVALNVHAAAHCHVAYGIVDPSFYSAFFDALRDAIAERIGAAWTADIAAAWQRQSLKILQLLPDHQSLAKEDCAGLHTRV